MLVVADSSALIALAVCGALDLLDQLFEQVRVPGAVYDEVTVPGRAESEALRVYLGGKVNRVEALPDVESATGLGRGELEALALYRSLNADRLLVDDARARSVAKLQGVRAVGSLGVLLLAKREERIPSVRIFLDRLLASDIRVAEHLVEEVLRLAGEERQ